MMRHEPLHVHNTVLVARKRIEPLDQDFQDVIQLVNFVQYVK